jgi:hypothetical protein
MRSLGAAGFRAERAGVAILCREACRSMQLLKSEHLQIGCYAHLGLE